MSKSNLLFKYSLLLMVNLLCIQQASSQLLELDFTSEKKEENSSSDKDKVISDKSQSDVN